MKIRAVRATPVNIPLERPYYWSTGIYPGTSKTVIEVETDQGLTGLGESPSWNCAVRTKLPFSEYFAFRPASDSAPEETTPKAVAIYCARMREEHGATYFEGKLTLGDPDLEIAAVREIREAIGPDAMLRLDANMAWSLSSARHVLRAIEPYNVRNYEDPVATFDEMAKLRQHSPIPFSTHTPDLRSAVRLGVPDTFVLNLAVLGGISRTLKFIAACEAMGVGFWCYSGDSGVASSAYLHVMAATHWIHEPSQCLFRWQCDDVIEEGPFKPRHNVLEVPQGPGLGVTLSPTALRRCHERFRSEGPYNHYHDPHAPGKMRRLPFTEFFMFASRRPWER